MLSKLKKKYYELPPSLLSTLHFLPITYRLGGRRFTETSNFIEQSERWDCKKLRRYQAWALNEVLSYAVRNVAFYKDIRLEGDAFKDIKKFPMMKKDDVIENFSKLVSKDATFPDSYLDSTGGSSGRQFRFYASNPLYAIEWAFIIALWKRAGYMLGDRVVSFRGGSTRFRGKLWRDEPMYNALAMSPFNMNTLTLPLYVDKIRRWKPKFIYGYPSAITIIAKYILEKQIDNLPRIRSVLLASEQVYPFQREAIEKAFEARTLSWYGQSEKVVLAGECEFTRNYHVFPQYGYMELLGEDGDLIEESGQQGEIVGTGFFNFAMPFIKYRTEDYATISEQKACQCGRDYLLIENVKGRRLQEMVVGTHGSLISLTALNIHSEEFDRLYSFQYYQDHPGEVVLRIRPCPSFTKGDKKNMVQTLKNIAGDEMEIIIDDASEIELTSTGKAKLLVQRLDLSGWWNTIGEKN
jgi:phenylacetate-CoA ligase